MKQIHCAICGNKEDLKTLYPATFNIEKLTKKTFSARRTPDRMHYQFVLCQSCGLIFSNPILPKEKIVSLYKKSTFDYPTESIFLKKTYGDLLTKLISWKKYKNIKLLDIGCGNGFFMEESLTRGVTGVYGVEPGRESVLQASKEIKKRIVIDIFRKNLFKKDFFDVITCFHTLDHIIDPNSFLENVFFNLKKKGKILFVVHNTNGLSVKLFGEKSPIFDIEHIYLFNESTLCQLFKLHGFGNIQVINLKNTYQLSYWLRMVPLPKAVKGIVLNVAHATKLDTIPFTFSAGNIAILAEKI